VEQTIGDVNLWIIFGNKMMDAKKYELVLDCVIELHSLNHLIRVYLNFDIPPRRAAIVGVHMVLPQVPSYELDLKIPLDPLDLKLPQYAHSCMCTEFLPHAA